ncbi:4'-phosphopantetheinyl transferase family protein [Sporosarcina limicola]|uniref:4'-phosphopantetheinyl transferase n=1 Tax=Sporosarcina limicola TaxID=34101 RepID=A0A927MFZ1_9BACL|nr:4'-phosphopantetheinyl transferase superfamily protein [Sporosarcina limicola]MBE1553153.1 4'-phosphopantetheinyl transferase [Sporosarcina limicola]
MCKSGLRLFALKIGQQLSQLEWDAFILNLPDEDCIRLMKYKHWKDRQRHLLGNLVVRWTIRRFTDEQQPVQFARNKAGRPYLIGSDSWNGDFNLSHSGDWLVVAFAEKGCVGIDIEKIGELNEEVMAYIMSQAEIKMIHQRPEIDRKCLFYELWTRKESIYKTGLFPNATPKSLDTVQVTNKFQKIYTHSFYVDPEHPVSISWNEGMPPDELTVLDRCLLV